MAQFRTTADLIDAILNRAGEPTGGTSPYEADALTYANKIHHGLIAGGLIFGVEIDDDWAWGRRKHPIVLKLEAPYETGTITATNGADAITFSTAPTQSVENWYVRFSGESTVYRIMHHTAANTAAQLDSHYLGTTGAKSFTVFKLCYDVVPTHLYVRDTSNKLDFGYSGSTEVTATLAHGSYTPSELATQVNTQLTASGGGASTYTCTYSSITRKFTLTSNRQSSNVFILYGAGTNSAVSCLPTLGFDYETQANAASHTSMYPLGGISRIISPVRSYRNGLRGKDIAQLDYIKFNEDYPVAYATEKAPSYFTITREQPDGLHTIRFDSYPGEEMKIEIEVAEVPLDLKDNTASIPKIPRKHFDILEYGAAHFILVDKEDDKANAYAQFAKAQLILMQNAHRAQLRRTDSNFGLIIPRRDLVGPRTGRRYGYDKNGD